MVTIVDDKKCSMCLEVKPLTDFHKAGKNGFHSKCKICVKEYNQKYKLRNAIKAWLKRKAKEQKKTYPIQKKCIQCKKKKFMVDFVSRGETSKLKDGTIRFSGKCRKCENLRQKKYHADNKDILLPKAKERMNKFRKENPERYRETRLRSRKNQRDRIDDGYIKRLLCDRDNTNLKWEDITDDMIDLYRTKLKIKRKLKEAV